MVLNLQILMHKWLMYLAGSTCILQPAPHSLWDTCACVCAVLNMAVSKGNMGVNIVYYLGLCWRDWGIPQRNSSQDTWCPDWDLNHSLPKYKSRALLLGQPIWFLGLAITLFSKYSSPLLDMRILHHSPFFCRNWNGTSLILRTFYFTT
jgi:hypothetical protein